MSVPVNRTIPITDPFTLNLNWVVYVIKLFQADLDDLNIRKPLNTHDT